jgi:hypothetical protein
LAFRPAFEGRRHQWDGWDEAQEIQSEGGAFKKKKMKHQEGCYLLRTTDLARAV